MNSEHIESYLSGELSDSGKLQVERALSNDSELRERFLEQMEIDAALSCLLSDSEERGSFDEAVLARLRNEGAEDSRAFAKSVLTEIVEERDGAKPIQWPDLLKAAAISAAASIALMFVLQGIIFREGTDAPGSAGDRSAAASYVARLEQSKGLVWGEPTRGKIREDGWLSTGRIEIAEGEALLAFNSGATATIEGPASLSIETSNRVFLHRGKLTADVPPPATGFTVNTERINVVDIGTRFGVSVGENGDSELHVMEGEVEASRPYGNLAVQLVQEGSALRADGRTRSNLEPISYGGDLFLMRVGDRVRPEPDLRYLFDGSGGNPIEDSGASRQFEVPLVPSGQLDTAPKRGPGRVGGGLLLQPGRYLEVPLSGEFRLEDPFTLAFWIRIPPKLEAADREVLFRYGREALGWEFSSQTSVDSASGGVLRVDFAGGTLTGTTDLADGNWHHVTCRYLGESDEPGGWGRHLHVFIDGVEETVRLQGADAPEKGRVGVLQLGHPGSEGFEGSLDELHLFREAIPTTMIQELSGD